MGARHSTPSGPGDAGDVERLAVAADSSPRPQVDGGGGAQATAAAAAPGTSRSSGTAVPTSNAGHALAKQRAAQRASAAAAHRRLVLDMLAASGVGGRSASTGSHRAPSSNDSTPEDSPLGRTLLTSSSLPLHIFALRDIKCPVCHKMIPADNVECHLVMCLTKPRINYNEDVLNEDKEECVICLEELRQGDVIARLPCLCIYHKSCIDQWFKVNRSCPEHPDGLASAVTT